MALPGWQDRGGSIVVNLWRAAPVPGSAGRTVCGGAERSAIAQINGGTEDDQREFVDLLLGSTVRGARLLAHVGPWVDGLGRPDVAVGVVSIDADDVCHAIAIGSMRVRLSTGAEEIVIDGTTGAEIVRRPHVQRVSILAPDRVPTMPDPIDCLLEGAVRSNGCNGEHLIPARSRPPDPLPEPPAPTEIDVAFSQLGGTPASPPTVEGVLCSRGHFNDPRSHFCHFCGLAMHHASFILIRQTRPQLGVLVFDDGEGFELTGPVIIGREPDTRHGLQTLTPSHSTSTMSRVHAEIRADGWDVVLIDRNSSNGTFVWQPGIRAWRRLAPDQPETLVAGVTVAFGQRTARFDTSVLTR